LESGPIPGPVILEMPAFDSNYASLVITGSDDWTASVAEKIGNE
jgi:hypothetical protein